MSLILEVISEDRFPLSHDLLKYIQLEGKLSDLSSITIKFDNMNTRNNIIEIGMKSGSKINFLFNNIKTADEQLAQQLASLFFKGRCIFKDLISSCKKPHYQNESVMVFK